MPKTVAVGLSGGIDSTLTALLLKEAGYHVIGLSMSIYNKDIPNMTLAGKSCYGPEEKQDLKDIQAWGADNGIPVHILDLSEVYKKTVLAYFKQAYLSGITPNPCIKCNAEMKFGLLLETARQSGLSFDAFATGHYARIEAAPDGHFVLKKGMDAHKDQSYFLYRLTQSQLAQTLFPLGHLTKDAVREMARARGLAVADKADSQDFYAGDYNDLLGEKPRPGAIVLTTGEVLGQHQGFWNYTIGQRKGLGIAYPKPLFVVDVDAEANTVIVGTAEAVFRDSCVVEDVVWGGFLPPLSEPTRAEVKYRSTGRPVSATLTPLADGSIRVDFDTPERALTAGQSAVFYRGDAVIGGGIIAKEKQVF